MKTLLDVYYSDEKNIAKTLDIYLPDEKPSAIFIYMHGGGLEKGNC